MSLDRYRQVMALARQHDVAAYAWLSDGLNALQDGRKLSDALGLTGGRALARRNRLIVEAGELAAPYASPWAQAGALECAIARAEASNDRSKLSAMIRDISIYGRLPRSQRQLYSIIKAEKEAYLFQ